MRWTDDSGLLAECPSVEELAAYNLGKLPAGQIESVAVHLSGCTRCEDVLVALPDEDPVLAHLRGCADGDTEIEEPGCGRLEALARAIAVDSASIYTVVDAPNAAATVAGPNGRPRVFGPYELLERVGQGGMGVVYRARQLSLNREVALKLIRGGAAASPEELARFRVEGEALARLRHPGVLLIHDLGEHEGELYLAAEYVAGGSLAHKLEDGPLPERTTADLLRQVALAVQAAHEARVVHRDLKPSNILLDNNGVPKVGDFGLAKLLDAESGQTVSGALLGTPSYMAPEQTGGRSREVGPAADVYALGAVLYECLTGKPPFRAARRTETLEQVRTREPVPPSRLKPGLAAELEAVCLKCLEKAPSRRYPSAQALADDLACWLHGEPTRVRPASRLTRIGKSMRRHPRLSLAAAVTVLALVVLSAGLILFEPDRAARAIEARLERGEAVTLIGDTGEPKWSHWLSGERSARGQRGADGTFSVYTPSVSLLELVRDPHRPRYRLRAQVRHDTSRDTGAIGLFFCAQRPGSPGAGFAFLQLTFNDISSPGPQLERMTPEARRLVLRSLKGRPPNEVPRAPVRLGLCLHAERAGAPPWYHDWSSSTPKLFEPAGFADRPWRTLVVEVTPAGVSGFWGAERAKVGELSFAEAVRGADHVLDFLRQTFPNDVTAQALQPALAPGGSLGLFVSNGTASFRRVVIEPVD